MSHTPGPWTFSIDDDGIVDESGQVFVADRGPGRVVVAEIPNQLRRTEANARLIAAAPELLQALKDVVGLLWPETLIAIENPMMLAGARAVIAKAEGR